MTVVKISVLGVEYSVMFGNREELELDSERDGECHLFNKTVKVLLEKDDVCICESDVNERAKEILTHELLHAFLCESGYDISEDEEERLCNWYMRVWKRLDNCIYEVLDKSLLI